MIIDTQHRFAPQELMNAEPGALPYKDFHRYLRNRMMLDVAGVRALGSGVQGILSCNLGRLLPRLACVAA